ncbi:sulfate ABC transporter substrate-binding protein [Nocardioides euryhalodurans]|uniref:Sulfate ABC transporter substrate-binding protein n=1 Tax=Nocardioides euryhalodurans TaxID=2518370 RepID=A0A4P7GL15_9ACTN|nr:sulfate ABC transporter substrate-binding protein [Nocardioides euryhalodurans]QBR92477.1 sulfate ABC transporter substrate-binding protein [Nocardioides euryhalodurans]
MKLHQKAAAAGLVAALSLSACSTAGAGGTGDGPTLSLNAFSVMEAANEPVIEDFTATSEGEGVTFETSYGASGDQSRAVVAGADADVVHYSLETDVTRLVDEGLVAEDWKDNETNGIATSSVVVFVVRSGNPEGIETWDDLVEPGVEIITPNPGSSGSARWNILAAWAHVTGNGGSEEEAKSFLTKLLGNTIALPGSGREATTAFTDGSGDVLLSYENEAILAKQSGADIDYVVPPDTLLIENPAAVTADADETAEAFLAFMTGPEAQADYASAGFRPVVDGVEVGEVEGANDPSDPFPTPEQLFTVDEDFNGWAEAADKYFGDGEDGNPLGIITELQLETGKVGEE